MMHSSNISKNIAAVTWHVTGVRFSGMRLVGGVGIACAAADTAAANCKLVPATASSPAT